MGDPVKQKIEQSTKHFSTYKMRCALLTDHYRAYFMQPADADFNSRLQSVRVVQTPEGISIIGDCAPQNPDGTCGVHSAYGYNLDWFGERRSAEYLCEKFLRRIWRRDKFVAFAEELAHTLPEVAYELPDFEDYAASHQEAYNALCEACQCAEFSGAKTPEEEELTTRQMRTSTLVQDTFGVAASQFYGYPIQTAATLIGIQVRFSELYGKVRTP